MEKGKSCSKKSIPTVEGAFKIRICDSKEELEMQNKKENGSKTWKETSK